ALFVRFDALLCGRRPQRELFEDVLRSLDELRSFADQPMAALRKRRVDRAGEREDLASLLGGEPCGDQRPRVERCFDDEDAAGEAAYEAIPLRKILLERRRARSELRNHKTAGDELVREIAIARRIDPIGSRADHRNAASCMAKPAAMRG